MRDIIKAIRTTVVLWLITAIFYPLVLVVIGQVAFNYQANGSLITDARGTVIGSALIGQEFTSDRYFWSRPSAINYSSFKLNERNRQKIEQVTGLSGGSNLAPTNPDLLQQVKQRIETLKLAKVTPVADSIYTSGSGLDPHISIEAARAQVQRVAVARALNPNQVELLVTKYIEGRFLGIFGEPGVNVLLLNQALDSLPGTA